MNAPQLQPPQKCGFSTIHHKHVLGQLIQPSSTKPIHESKTENAATVTSKKRTPLRSNRYIDHDYGDDLIGKGFLNPARPLGSENTTKIPGDLTNRFPICTGFLTNIFAVLICPISISPVPAPFDEKKGMILSNSGCKCKH